MSFLAGKRKIVAALAGLLCFMLLCTLISKSVYGSQLPQITVAEAQKRVLGRSIQVDGAVAQSREYAVSTLPSIRVDTVEVGKGDVVEEGTLLFSLNMQDLKEQIAAQELAVKKLEVQIATLQHNQSLADQDAVKNTDRLLEDYMDAAAENAAAVDRARIREEEADADYKKHMEDAPGMTDEEGRRQARDAYNAWVERGKKLQAEADRLTRALSEAEGQVEEARRALEAAQGAGGQYFAVQRMGGMEPEAEGELSDGEETGGGMEVSNGADLPENAEPTERVEQAGTVGASDSAGLTEVPEPSEDIERTEATEPSGSAERTEAAEPSGSAERTEATEPSGSADRTEATEPSGSTDQTEAAESPDGSDQTEAAEPSEEEAPTESPEAPDASDGTDTDPEVLRKRLQEAEARRDALAAELADIQDKLQKHQADSVEEPDFSAEDMEQKNWEAQGETLRRNAESAGWAYEDALRQKEEALKEAQRKVDDSTEPQTLQDTLALNQLELAWLREVLAGYRKLEGEEGKITAPQKGVVTDIRVSAGSDTPDGAAVVYADQEENLEFRMIVSKEDKKYINLGSIGSLQIGGRKEDCAVEYMEQQADGSFLTLLSLPEGMGSMGESGTFALSWQSQSYPCCVLATAVHEENHRKYIYVVRRQQGILGEELAAEKRFVTVLEEGDTYVALEARALQEGEEVILTSTKTLSDGDIVRYRLSGTE